MLIECFENIYSVNVVFICNKSNYLIANVTLNYKQTLKEYENADHKILTNHDTFS